MGRRAKHTKTDWTLAAFETLGNDGIDGVKVERIAKTLGATKGSFYWHFADRPALLAHMLDYWEEEGTHQIITQLRESDSSASEKLKQLAEISSQSRSQGLDAIAVEGALRAWAGQDPLAADKLKSTEAVRMAFLEELLIEIGHKAPEGKVGFATALPHATGPLLNCTTRQRSAKPPDLYCFC